MKDKFQSLVGMRGACGWLNDPLITHLSPTNHPLKHGIGKYIFSFLLVLTMSIGQMWGDVTLFTADFSAAAWDGATFSQGNTNNYDVINGVTFNSKDGSKKFSISEGVLTWPNNNMSSSNFFLGFPVAGINDGTITISVWNGSSATRVKYVIKDNTDTFTASLGSSGTATSSASPTTATITSLSTKAFIYLGRQGSGQTTITKIVVTTPAPACAATAPGNISKGALSAGVLTLNAAGYGSKPATDEWYWQTAADGVDKSNSGASFNVSAAGTYYVRSLYNNDCWSDAKSITISASDFAAHYAITYNPGTGGSGTIAADEKVHDVAFTLSSEMFTRTGYVQVGWALSDGGTKAYDLGGSYTANEAEEFFPVWAEKDTYAAAFACSASAPAGWTFSTDDGWADNKTIAAYVCKFTENSVPAPGNNGMNENWVAFAKNTSAVATYDLGYATTISALNVTLYGGSSSAFNQTIEFVGADGTTVKKSYTNSLGAGNWAANNITKTDVVPNVRYIKVYGASKWVVMSAFSVTYGDLSTKYTVTYNLNGGTGTTPTQSALAAGKTFTLHNGTTGITAPTDKIFSNWKDQDDALFAGSAEYTMPAKNVTLTAQWADASSTYSVTYSNGGHGTAPDAESAVSVVLAELSASGWAHKGWTANVDVTVDAATVEAGTLIANGKTAILASDVTFTAVWSEIFTVTYNANGGTCETASATWTEGDAALVLPTATKDNWDFVGWYDAAIGGNKIASPYSPSATIELFAHYMPKLVQAIYSNTFDAFIKNQAVDVYYLQGESQPTLSSIKVLGQESPVYEEVDGNIKVTVETVDYIFPVTKTAVAPHVAGTGDQETFDGTETYIKTGYTYNSGWRFSKTDSDWSRESDGRTRLYFFLGAADHFTLESTGTSRAMKVYRNGVLLDEPTASGSNPSIAGSNVPAMYAIVSNQTGGDGKFTAITLAPWVPVTEVTLKEGTTPISSKEIYATASFTLTAEVTPDNASNKTITWTSSDDAIATVADGVVTGVAANATPVTITASTVDGVTATCEVTVTAAPEPSAAPVITTQPADGNYYEEATIAALEVVATGESLSYQWYLGSDAISGAESATYTPTVSAIGSYVYHCVVTNTEAGKLPASLASDNATITIAEDPSAIKLLDGEGNVNTTNFTTGVTAGTVNFDDADHNCAEFGSTGGSIVGLTGLNKVVAYNATKTQTKVKFVLYNTNNAEKELYLQKVVEGATEAVTETIAVPSKERHETLYYTYNSSDLRSFYVTTNSTDVKILQMKVIEDGTLLKRAGEAGYEVNLNQGRVLGAQNVAATFEGFAFTPSSNAKVLNSTELQIKTPLSFTIAAPLTLTVTTSSAKYYVSQNSAEDGTTATAITAAGEETFDLTVAGTWYIVPSTSSAVKITNIAFTAPKCAEPTIDAQPVTNVTFGAGNLTASVTAHVNDGGTLSYQWYNASDDSEVTGADEATLTTTTEGTYYVIVTNSLADHQDNSTKSNDATLGYRTLNDATLSALSYGDPATAIALEADKYEYRVILNEGTVDVPALHATATMDPYPTVTITDATSFTDYTAQSTVHVTAEDGVTELTYTVNFVVKHIYTSLEDVTASTTWNWTGVEASDVDINDVANRGVILGNYIGGSNFEMMEGKAGEKAFRNQNDGVYQGTYLHFNTTVPGRVKFYFRAPSSGENCTITVKNGGRTTIAGARGNSFGWSSEVFVYGDVVIEMENDKAGGGTTRVQQVVFTAADPDYTRPVTEGRYGTICLPKAGVMVGATLYEIAYYGATSEKIFFDDIPTGEMEAGVPYIFLPREGASQLGVFYTDEAGESAKTANGLIGFIGASADEYFYIPDGDGNYILQNNLYREVLAGAQARILSNRAYIKLSAINPSEPALAPGRRRVSMSVLSEQVTTGMENTGFESEAPRKVLINGELFIIRGEKMFDAKGQLVK